MKTLPLFPPLFLSYPQHAHITAILQNHIEHTSEWIIENYLTINCFMDKTKKYAPFIVEIGHVDRDNRFLARKWEECPFLKVKIHDDDLVQKKWNSLSSFAKDAIDSQYYVNVCIYPQSIKAYHLGAAELHPILIHGYDEEQKMLFCSDHFGSPPRYTSIWIPYSEIDESFQQKLFCIQKISFERSEL